MKNKRLLSKLLEVTAMVICLSMLMALGGCSDTKSKKKDKKDSKYEDEEDEDEDEKSDDKKDNDKGSKGDKDPDADDADDADDDTDKDDKDDKDSDANSDSDKDGQKDGNKKPAISNPNGQFSATAPSDYDILSVEDIHDTWVNENGTYLHYNEVADTLVDYLGISYEVKVIYENGVILRVSPNSSVYYDTIYYTPAMNEFFFPMYVKGDELFVGENHLYRASSEQGQKYIKELEDSITNTEFRGSVFDMTDEVMSITFKDDGICTYYELDDPDYEDTYGWNFEDGILELAYEGVESDYGVFYKIAEDAYVLSSDYGDIIYLYDGDRDDANVLEGDYILYSYEDDMLYYSTLEGYDGSTYFLDGESAGDLDYKIRYDYYDVVAEFEHEDCELSGSHSALICYQEEDVVTFFRADTILGQLMLYREDVLNGMIENVFVRDEYTIIDYDTKVMVEARIKDYDKNTWDCEAPFIEIEPDYYGSGFVLGPITYVDNCYYPAEITYTIPKDMVASIDDLAVTASYSYFLDGYEYDGEYSVSETDEGYVISFETSEYMIYMSYGIMDTTKVEEYEDLLNTIGEEDEEEYPSR